MYDKNLLLFHKFAFVQREEKRPPENPCLLEMTWSLQLRTYSICGCLHGTHTTSSSQGFTVGRRGAQETPTLVEELLAIDGCWRKKTNFSVGVCLLVGAKAPVDGSKSMSIGQL